MLRRILFATVLPAALVTGACSDNGTGPGTAAPGMFTAQISGSASRAASGLAAFGSLDILGNAGFGIAMEDDGADVVITIGKQTEGRPVTGTYTLGDTDAPLYAEVSIGSGAQSQFYVSTSGTLTITASSPQSLQGTVTFSARNEFGQGQIQVTANFNAFCFAGGALSCD